jgi:ATP-dependent RNA helicase RhlE
MTDKTFADLGLSQPVLRALGDCGYTHPTPIQEVAIPIVAAGTDLIGNAQTGTGKTAAFTLPIIDDISTRPSYKGDTPLCLILEPTRELAVQVHENILEYGKHTGARSVVIVGGVSSVPQIETLRRGVDFVVATPGRLIDLVEQGEVVLNDVEFLILDEADRMLDMGFVHDVRWIADKVPRPRQTLLFSATISSEVKSLASTMQTNPEHVAVAPPATVADNIDEQIMFMDKLHKRDVLLHLLNKDDTEQTLVFTATKVAASLVAKQLDSAGIRAVAIHSNKTQAQRASALKSFVDGKSQVLVATDIVARGIDVENISHVINYEMPENSENYIHRIGRTARAGKKGSAVSLVCIEDVSYLRSILRLLQENEVNVVDDHPWHSALVAGAFESAERAGRTRARAGKGRGSGSKWNR